MTYINAPSKLRLGHTMFWNTNIAWNSLFFKSIRHNILLNTLLKGLLRYFKIKLVKWFGNYEALYFNFGLLVHYWSKSLKPRFKKYKFFNWNKHYTRFTARRDSKLSYVGAVSSFKLLVLPDYFYKQKFHITTKPWLGSGFLPYRRAKKIIFSFWWTRRNFAKMTTLKVPRIAQSKKKMQMYLSSIQFFSNNRKTAGFKNFNMYFKHSLLRTDFYYSQFYIFYTIFSMNFHKLTRVATLSKSRLGQKSNLFFAVQLINNLLFRKFVLGNTSSGIVYSNFNNKKAFRTKSIFLAGVGHKYMKPRDRWLNYGRLKKVKKYSFPFWFYPYNTLEGFYYKMDSTKRIFRKFLLHSLPLQANKKARSLRVLITKFISKKLFFNKKINIKSFEKNINFSSQLSFSLVQKNRKKIFNLIFSKIKNSATFSSASNEDFNFKKNYYKKFLSIYLKKIFSKSKTALKQKNKNAVLRQQLNRNWQSSYFNAAKLKDLYCYLLNSNFSGSSSFLENYFRVYSDSLLSKEIEQSLNFIFIAKQTINYFKKRLHTNLIAVSFLIKAKFTSNIAIIKLISDTIKLSKSFIIIFSKLKIWIDDLLPSLRSSKLQNRSYKNVYKKFLVHKSFLFQNNYLIKIFSNFSNIDNSQLRFSNFNAVLDSSGLFKKEMFKNNIPLIVYPDLYKRFASSTTTARIERKKEIDTSNYLDVVKLQFRNDRGGIKNLASWISLLIKGLKLPNLDSDTKLPANSLITHSKMSLSKVNYFYDQFVLVSAFMWQKNNKLVIKKWLINSLFKLLVAVFFYDNFKKKFFRYFNKRWKVSYSTFLFKKKLIGQNYAYVREDINSISNYLVRIKGFLKNVLSCYRKERQRYLSRRFQKVINRNNILKKRFFKTKIQRINRPEFNKLINDVLKQINFKKNLFFLHQVKIAYGQSVKKNIYEFYKGLLFSRKVGTFLLLPKARFIERFSSRFLVRKVGKLKKSGIFQLRKYGSLLKNWQYKSDSFYKIKVSKFISKSWNYILKRYKKRKIFVYRRFKGRPAKVRLRNLRRIKYRFPRFAYSKKMPAYLYLKKKKFDINKFLKESKNRFNVIFTLKYFIHNKISLVFAKLKKVIRLAAFVGQTLKAEKEYSFYKKNKNFVLSSSYLKAMEKRFTRLRASNKLSSRAKSASWFNRRVNVRLNSALKLFNESLYSDKLIYFTDRLNKSDLNLQNNLFSKKKHLLKNMLIKLLPKAKKLVYSFHKKNGIYYKLNKEYFGKKMVKPVKWWKKKVSPNIRYFNMIKKRSKVLPYRRKINFVWNRKIRKLIRVGKRRTRLAYRHKRAFFSNLLKPFFLYAQGIHKASWQQREKSSLEWLAHSKRSVLESNRNSKFIWDSSFKKFIIKRIKLLVTSSNLIKYNFYIKFIYTLSRLISKTFFSKPELSSNNFVFSVNNLFKNIVKSHIFFKYSKTVLNIKMNFILILFKKFLVPTLFKKSFNFFNTFKEYFYFASILKLLFKKKTSKYKKKFLQVAGITRYSKLSTWGKYKALTARKWWLNSWHNLSVKLKNISLNPRRDCFITFSTKKFWKAKKLFKRQQHVKIWASRFTSFPKRILNKNIRYFPLKRRCRRYIPGPKYYLLKSSRKLFIKRSKLILLKKLARNKAAFKRSSFMLSVFNSLIKMKSNEKVIPFKKWSKFGLLKKLYNINSQFKLAHIQSYVYNSAMRSVMKKEAAIRSAIKDKRDKLNETIKKAFFKKFKEKAQQHNFFLNNITFLFKFQIREADFKSSINSANVLHKFIFNIFVGNSKNNKLVPHKKLIVSSLFNLYKIVLNRFALKLNKDKINKSIFFVKKRHFISSRLLAKSFVLFTIVLKEITRIALVKLKLPKNNIHAIREFNLVDTIRYKRFYLWFKEELQKILHIRPIKLHLINAVRAIIKSKSDDLYSKKSIFLQLRKKSKLKFVYGGWKTRYIFRDIFWTIIISVKYMSASYFSSMLAEQLTQRKKHLRFLHNVNKFIRYELRFGNPKFSGKSSIYLDCFKFSVNGKVNGRNRAINFILHKYNINSRVPPLYENYITIDYSMSFSETRYGSMAVKVWISRI